MIISSGAGSAASKLFRQLSNATPPLKTGTTIETVLPCKLWFVRGKIVTHPLCPTNYVSRAGESQNLFTVDEFRPYSIENGIQWQDSNEIDWCFQIRNFFRLMFAKMKFFRRSGPLKNVHRIDSVLVRPAFR
jgi:hypothetical protein